MNIIEAKNLSHEYIVRDEEGNVENIVTAIDNVDISVKKGHFISILGHNGSGKSTFAKHINALLYPSGGTLFVNQMDANDKDNTLDIRKSAGMVFQNPDNQIIASVVEEDVGFGPENIGVPTDEIWERVEKSLKSVGMWEYRKHSPNKLSGGQKQRVAIARALAMEPEILLFDEPTSALDPQMVGEVLEVMRTLAKDGLTMIIVTHEMAFARDVAKHVIFMGNGVIVEEGTSQQIFEDPQNEMTKEFLSRFRNA